MMKVNMLQNFIFFLLLLPVSAWCQVTVTGTVTDAVTKEPLIGVTILEKETEQGTVSDLDGRFSIVLKSVDPTLVIRYTGYMTVELKPEGRTDVSIEMREEAIIFEQLVVVGYGIQKKSDLTGAVSTVKGEDIARVTTSSVEQALQGKVSGVYVSPTSGAPGAGAVIRIRGTGTLNNANPLYVIDGMITYDASIVNPQDVQSIEVLKDASAAAIYGSRGANGVIIITTKSGVPRERAIIKASAYYGVQEITKKLDLLNGSEFASVYNDFRNQLYFPNPDTFGTGTDWQDEIFQSAPIYNATVGANGGNKQTTYNFSANYFSQDGTLKNSHFDRLVVRFNAEYKLTPSIALGHNLAHYNIRTQNAPGGVITGAYRMPPIYAPRNANGDFTDPTFFGLALANPAADLFYKSNNHDKGNKLFGNVYIDIDFLKNFTFRSNLGVDKFTRMNRAFEPEFKVSASQLNLNDRLSVSSTTGNEWIWEQTLSYDRTWGEHHITALAGYTAEERKFEVLGGSRENFPGTAEELLFLSAGNDTTQMNSNFSGDEALVSNIFRVNYTGGQTVQAVLRAITGQVISHRRVSDGT
jgi:TonB-linked SusC/RagA family outer membrane protein